MYAIVVADGVVWGFIAVAAFFILLLLFKD